MFWLKQTVGTTVTFHDIRTTGYPFTTTTVTTDDTTRFQIVFKSDAYTTQLVNNNCNITLADLNDLLFCIQVPGASGYIFEVTEVANPANVRTITRTVSSFSFQILPGITPLSTQYSVRVSPIVGGLSQGFGRLVSLLRKHCPRRLSLALVLVLLATKSGIRFILRR
jgi:hypothetical protein